jgi:hypothetical protein
VTHSNCSGWMPELLLPFLASNKMSSYVNGASIDVTGGL